jgi:hypothetical protein
VKTPYWEDARDRVEMRHYTDALADYPPFVALCEALERRRDELVKRLTSSASDHADSAQLHALRGEIRGIHHVLDAPRSEAKKHQERQTG